MGRWAQARRRGTVARGWTLDPPLLTDFSLTEPGGAGTSIQINRLVPLPPPATAWTFEAYDNGSFIGVATSSSTSDVFGVFPAGHVITARVRWALLSGQPLSDWSPFKAFTSV